MLAIGHEWYACGGFSCAVLDTCWWNPICRAVRGTHWYCIRLVFLHLHGVTLWWPIVADYGGDHADEDYDRDLAETSTCDGLYSGPACSQNTAQTHWWRSPYSRTLSSERPRLNCCRGPTRITQWPVSCPPLAANDARGTAEAVSLVGERTVDAHWLRFPLISVCRGEMGIGHCGCCGWSTLAKLDVTCRRRVVAVRTRGASDTRLSIQHLHRGMSQWKSPVIGTGGGAAFLAETQSYCLNVLLFSCRSLRSDSGRSLNTHADSMSDWYIGASTLLL